jgi:RimJ/RimL family protein N-acetyltransferase
VDGWTRVPVLAGRHVRLVPLEAAHAPGLAAAAADGALWTLRVTSVPAPGAEAAYIAQALAERDAGRALPFAVLDAEGAVVGATRFGHLDPHTRRAEIGWTWYARRVQRTALNTEAKRLLLAHAFGTAPGELGCVAVELRTHVENAASRAAIERLGARLDGVLRRHLRMPDGHVRDTAVYSILDTEWPGVRARLDAFLAGPHA